MLTAHGACAQSIYCFVIECLRWRGAGLLQVCTLSSLLPLPLLGLVPNTTGAEELQRKADEDAAEN